MNELNEIEIIDGKAFFILYRNTERSPSDECGFCGLRHTHGWGEGHRTAHCVKNHHSDRETVLTISYQGKNYQVTNGDGYVVRTRDLTRDTYKRKN